MSQKNVNEKILIPLTAKEKAALEFVEGFLKTHGIAPSYQEIREHFQWASLNSVQRYLQQLQNKGYIHMPGGNLKRAISILHSANEIQSSLGSGVVSGLNQRHPILTPNSSEIPSSSSPTAESLTLPLLGRVAAGIPIEALEHNEFVSVPTNWVRHPERTYALRVEGESMIEDGIWNGDLIFVQRQEMARNGETVVAMVNHQATVKKFYLHQQVHRNPQSDPQLISPRQEGAAALVELRPANASMSSFWLRPDQVQIQGVVVGLIRKY